VRQLAAALWQTQPSDCVAFFEAYHLLRAVGFPRTRSVKIREHRLGRLHAAPGKHTTKIVLNSRIQQP
jgi:hypothetical protein